MHRVHIDGFNASGDDEEDVAVRKHQSDPEAQTQPPKEADKKPEPEKQRAKKETLVVQETTDATAKKTGDAGQMKSDNDAANQKKTYDDAAKKQAYEHATPKKAAEQQRLEDLANQLTQPLYSLTQAGVKLLKDDHRWGRSRR